MVRISKILEGLIAQTAFDCAKSGVTHCLKDSLMLAMLRSEGSLAFEVLSGRLKDWEIYQIGVRLEYKISQHNSEGQDVESFFHSYTEALKERFSSQAHTLSSLHALIDILEDATTLSSAIFARYKITTRVVEQAMFDATDASLTAEFTQVGQPAEPQALLVEKFGTDLTRLAAEGKIDPVIGRESEIERVIQILSRRKKNNPVIVGDAGVGKSAVVEGLALRIASGCVPHAVVGKRIISLDIASLVAGTKFRGEFEERIQQIIDELKGRRDIILFIDEIHTIVGAGQSQGSLDTANILKPALSRGEIQVVGATTFEEYHSSIERDAALERRFQRVILTQTSIEQTHAILSRIAPKYEAFHGVTYTPAALKACVELSARYITDRNFPDKAIDLLDEAGSAVSLTAKEQPAELKELETALTRTSAERKDAIEKCAYNSAMEARLRQIAINHRIKEMKTRQQSNGANSPIIVTADDIARTLTAITGVPVQRVKSGGAAEVSELQNRLLSRVIGQNEAVERLTMAIKRSYAGLKDENRPCGVFLFVGPSGVGKTLLAKELALALMGDKDALIRLDMSEYGERHNVSRLFGSPPGYVGYGEGGQLSEAVRRRPYSVVLLDEIEKAHPEVFNAMLQIFDEGRLTDGEGRNIDFRNTIIIMTSNAGSQSAARYKRIGFATPSETAAAEACPKSEYGKALERIFRPEFLNRVDDIILFNTLKAEDAQRIVALELDVIVSRLKGVGYDILITPEVSALLVALCRQTNSGVRALKQLLRDRVEEPLSNLIIDSRLQKGEQIQIDATNGEIVIKSAVR